MALSNIECHPVESEEVGFCLPLSAQSIGTYGFPLYRFPKLYHLDTVLLTKLFVCIVFVSSVYKFRVFHIGNFPSFVTYSRSLFQTSSSIKQATFSISNPFGIVDVTYIEIDSLDISVVRLLKYYLDLRLLATLLYIFRGYLIVLHYWALCVSYQNDSRNTIIPTIFTHPSLRVLISRDITRPQQVTYLSSMPCRPTHTLIR